jgi:hypothetical protein
MIDECGQGRDRAVPLTWHVDSEIEDGQLVIRSTSKAREGWAQAFEHMHHQKSINFLDQGKNMGKIDESAQKQMLTVLAELFAP